jgi:hypothetical protein
MKTIANLLLLLSVFSISELESQETTFFRIQKKFENFEYETAIQLINLELMHKDSVPEPLLLELYRMKAVSQYALGNEREAQASFLELLRVSPDYALDPLSTSPKIIHFFSLAKEAFLRSKKIQDEEQQHRSSVDTAKPQANFDLVGYNSRIKSSLWRSLLLPGYGHYYSGQETKGIVLGVAAISTAASFFYVNDVVNRRHQDYLNEVEPAIINEKYNNYNTAYKWRIVCGISYVAIWAFSQLDLFYFSEDVFAPKIEVETTDRSDISLSLQWNLGMLR